MPHANQALVTIAVQNERLSIYPQRADDLVIYCNSLDPKAGPRSPEKPKEVCWMVTGRKENQKIRIRSKSSGTGARIFGKDAWEIPGERDDTAESGPVLAPPVQGQIGAWHYEVLLLEDGKTLDHIDPTVVIKTDP